MRCPDGKGAEKIVFLLNALPEAGNRLVWARFLVLDTAFVQPDPLPILAAFHFRQIRDPATDSFAYLLGCAETARAILIDPIATQLPLYQGVLRELELMLEWVLETHRHADATSGADALRELTGARVAFGRDTGLATADLFLGDGDQLQVGTLNVEVIATPGHTAGCLTYRWQDRLFTGHSLLIGGCGDFEDAPGNGGVLYDSVTRRLLSLPDETLVFPGQCLGGRRVSCIAEERERNPWFHGVSRDGFVSARAGRTPEQFWEGSGS